MGQPSRGQDEPSCTTLRSSAYPGIRRANLQDGHMAILGPRRTFQMGSPTTRVLHTLCDRDSHSLEKGSSCNSNTFPTAVSFLSLDWLIMEMSRKSRPRREKVPLFMHFKCPHQSQQPQLKVGIKTFLYSESSLKKN